MNKGRKTLTALLLLSGLFPVQTVLAQTTQPNEQNVRKEHLEYCVSQLTVQVAQIQAIEGIKKQPNLTGRQKLQQIGQILAPEQKQQLMACLEQPMPSPSP